MREKFVQKNNFICYGLTHNKCRKSETSLSISTIWHILAHFSVILFWCQQWEKIFALKNNFINCALIQLLRDSITRNEVPKIFPQQMLSCRCYYYFLFIYLFRRREQRREKLTHTKNVKLIPGQVILTKIFGCLENMFGKKGSLNIHRLTYVRINKLKGEVCIKQYQRG